MSKKAFILIRLSCVYLIFVLCLSACLASQVVAPAPVLPPPQATIVTSIPPTLTPSPTAVPTTEEWIYPYTIAGLREHEYQGGEIQVGDMLNETDVYMSYLISYPSDGLTITGVMQIPKLGKEPFPVILMNHGFFSRAVYTSGDGTDRAAEFLNRHGYLTLSSDYRSWGDSDVDYSLFYSGLVIDVINLMDAIPSIPQADPERIGMWGHSMGGGVTLKVLTIDPFLPVPVAQARAREVEGRIKAAVLYSTVSADDADIIARWGSGCIGDYLEGERLYGCNSSDILPLDLPPGLIQAYKETARNPDLLRQVAALHYLDDVSAPVQINYGTEDGKFFGGTPPEWSQKAYQGFIDAGKQAELFAYEGEGHSFVSDQWWAFMERSAHFFDEYVK
ncbi:MAG: alpha/beta fold hydrolase [Anaerolineales bacterium]|nr:alpha/beta fold hydrolase [Anaerolineales bacterium]